MKRNDADEQLIRYLTTSKSLRDMEIKKGEWMNVI